jgi:hypothetical protein
MTRAPKKWADSRMEVVRTVFAVMAGAGTLYLVLAKTGVI